MKNLLFCTLTLTIILVIGGCSLTNSSVEYPSPEQVLESYFEALNDKDVEKLLTTLQHEDNKHSESGLQKFVNAIEEIELISYSEDQATRTKEQYMTMGRGVVTKPKEVKIYMVNYRIKFYEDESEGAGISGEKTWNYILIRKDNNSPWVIDDWGY